MNAARHSGPCPASLTTPPTNKYAGLEPGAEEMKNNSSDCAASEADCQVFPALQARAARKGCTLRALSGGGYLMSQWGYSREVPDLRTVGDLLRRMGA